MTMSNINKLVFEGIRLLTPKDFKAHKFAGYVGTDVAKPIISDKSNINYSNPNPNPNPNLNINPNISTPSQNQQVDKVSQPLIIKKGDTLSGIAKSNQMDMNKFWTHYNSLNADQKRQANIIQPGQNANDLLNKLGFNKTNATTSAPAITSNSKQQSIM